jgi:Fe-S oxidoreductase
MAIFPKVSNFLSQNQLAKFLTKKIIGLTDLPYVSKKAFSTLPQGVEWFEYDKIKDLDENSKSVILLQDAFTSFFDSDSVEYTCNLMVSLGYKVYVVKFFKNGKAQHVKGFLDMFEKTVKGNENLFKKLKEVKIPLVAIEPSVTLTYRQEYKEFCNENIDVDTFPEWLHKEIQGNNVEKISLTGHKYSLFLHCTEQTNISNIKKIWMGIFSYFDMDVKIENSGCCGMSGIYGHETINQESSRKLFDGWEPILNENKKDKVVTLATGYSCRAQSKRFASFRPMYPSEAILIAIEEKNKTNKTTGK